MHPKDAHLPLLDAGIDAADEPHSNKDGKHSTENGERLTDGVHEGVIVGNLDFCQLNSLV